MQSNLKALSAGKREAVELPPKRGPGRPKKVREDEGEGPDQALEAVKEHALQREHVEVEMMQLAPKRSPGKLRKASERLAEAVGKASFGEVRMPGAQVKRRNEGPQVKLLGPPSGHVSR